MDFNWSMMVIGPSALEELKIVLILIGIVL